MEEKEIEKKLDNQNDKNNDNNDSDTNSVKNKFKYKSAKLEINDKGSFITGKKFKPIKKFNQKSNKSSLIVLEKIIDFSEFFMGKKTYFCGNPDCGVLIQFQKKSTRPVVCQMCGEGIDWEGEFIRRIKLCPKCNEEYYGNVKFCSFHYPREELIEKEIPK